MPIKTARIYAQVLNTKAFKCKKLEADTFTTSWYNDDNPPVYGYWTKLTSKATIQDGYNETTASFVFNNLSELKGALSAKIGFTKSSGGSNKTDSLISGFSPRCTFKASSASLVYTVSLSSGSESYTISDADVITLKTLDSLFCSLEIYIGSVTRVLTASVSSTKWYSSSEVNGLNGSYQSNVCQAYVNVSSAESSLPYIEYTYEELECSDVTVQGNSIDSIVNLSWECALQERYTIEAINEAGTTVATFTGTTQNELQIQPGKIKFKGKYKFKLSASGNNQSVIRETEYTVLSRIEPVIISLEPDSVSQNINKQINITWSTQNQQKYAVTLDGVIYSGTTSNAITLPSNTLTSGNKTMTLTITYTSSWGDVRTATKTVSFIAYGNPVKPILDGTTIYNTALPTFTWISNEQIGYELKLRNDISQDIISTGEIIGLTKQYTSSVALENNRSYTLFLRVKNQYNLWSEWASKVLTTSFVVPKAPTIEIITNNNASIIVSFNIEYTAIFSKAEIWRKSSTTDWIRVAYNLDNTFSYEDKFVGNETYYYKVRSIGSTGGIAESITVSATLGELTPIKNFHFTNVENFAETIELIGNPTVKLSNNRKIVSTVFAGSKAPKIDKGKTNYKSMSLSFTVKEDTYNKLIDVIDNANVLLYRDGRGRKFYCQVSSYPTVNYDRGSYLNISFGIVEVAFIEGDFYSGNGNQPSLFFDGTWFFDGTVKLNGEV